MLTHVLQPASLSAFNAASLSTSGAAPGSISSRKLSSKVTGAYRSGRPGFGFRPERPSSRCRQPRSPVWTQSAPRAPRPRIRGSGSRPRPRRDKEIPCHGIHILHARRRGRRAGEVGAARRRVGAERPHHAGREETAHGRCRWHVPRAVSGFSVSLKINIVAPAGEPLEIPGSDSARLRRVTASQGAAGAARGVGASRNAGLAADSAYAQDRPARYRTVTISAFWSA